MTIKYFLEEAFELTVTDTSIIYIDRAGEARIDVMPDGHAHFSGEESCFEGLYALLERRPELRMPTNVTIYTRQEDSWDRNHFSVEKVFQAANWLGILPAPVASSYVM